ncbi:dirigent protein 4-like [Durio zibethinus]|uniref:Dirigent protein n=1 Tax=Durio zibethinus TaxID=66656 RepID=A0A6P6ABL3_DURZI|nr:dirigent protein 4-like [Durio zibethinus]
MRRTSMLTWILILCLSMVPVHSQYHSQSLPLDPKAEKVTNLHFFLHETLSGKNPTAVMVAQANITSNDNNSPVPFGSVFTIDDPLKTGPDHNSELIGNAQGLGVLAGKNTTTVVLYLDFGFSKGKFKGSSISIFSRNPMTENVRELSVVGGRGNSGWQKGLH